MAITAVFAVSDARTAEENEKGEAIYVLPFEVFTDSPSVGGREVLSHEDIPQRGELYESFADTDVAAWCVRRRARQDAVVKQRWYVTCEFSSVYDDPFTRPVKRRYASAQEEEVITTAKNSAGEFFDPPPTRPVGWSVRTVEKNLHVEDFDADIYDSLLFSKNNAEFDGKAAGKVVFAAYNAEEVTENLDTDAEVTYMKVTATFWYKSAGWVLKLLDQGWRHLDASGVLVENLSDRDGMPFARPMRLDGEGGLLAEAEFDDVFIDVLKFEDGDLSLLNLDL